MRAIFDCSHSSLEPGAYDGEVLALAQILNLEATAQKKDGRGGGAQPVAMELSM